MSKHRFDHSVDRNDDTKDLSATARPRRIEVITGVERQRKWSAQAKAAIVAESLAEGAVVSEVARRHGLSPQQVFGDACSTELPVGDVLVVRWLDRLGRNYDDVRDTVQALMRKGVIVCADARGARLHAPGRRAIRPPNAMYDAALGSKAPF
jgi:transposase